MRRVGGEPISLVGAAAAPRSEQSNGMRRQQPTEAKWCGC